MGTCARKDAGKDGVASGTGEGRGEECDREHGREVDVGPGGESRLGVRERAGEKIEKEYKAIEYEIQRARVE